MAAPKSIAPMNNDIDGWIQSARAGSTEALGRLLEECRPYLLLVANQELPPELRQKAGASDLVQETCLRAHNNFDDFRDNGRNELIAWLRRILLNNLADLRRRHCDTDKRELAREIILRSDIDLDALPIPAPGPSPSSMIAATERDAALQEALARLPDPYRQVVQWRNYDRLTFEAIGERLGRSAAAARKLWVRAIEELQRGLSAFDEC